MAKLADRVLEAQQAYQALELWKRWFEEDGDPWTTYREFEYMCFFCSEDQPNHEPNCIYLAAKQLVTGSMEDKVLPWPDKSDNVHDIADRYRK